MSAATSQLQENSWSYSSFHFWSKNQWALIPILTTPLLPALMLSSPPYPLRSGMLLTTNWPALMPSVTSLYLLSGSASAASISAVLNEPVGSKVTSVSSSPTSGSPQPGRSTWTLRESIRATPALPPLRCSARTAAGEAGRPGAGASAGGSCAALSSVRSRPSSRRRASSSRLSRPAIRVF